VLTGLLTYELVAGLFTVVLLYLYLHISRKMHWFDPPDESRKLHEIAKPTAAGLIFMLPLLALLLTLPAFSYHFNYTVALALLVFLIMGGIDDFKNISARLRLIITLLVCAMTLFALFYQSKTSIYLLGIYLIGMIWWINLYNFMDGADGMAVLHALITMFGYLLAYLFLGDTYLLLSLYALLFIICLLSFLFFNFPRSKMFMGDAGSLSVAFMLAVFALYGLIQNHYGVTLIVSFHLVFIIDATLTLLARIKYKHKITQAHSLHLYQCLIHKGLSHAKVSALYALFTVILVSLALAFHYFQLDLSLKISILVLETLVLSFLWLNFHKKNQFAAFIQ